jgi:hypothetical protein
MTVVLVAGINSLPCFLPFGQSKKPQRNNRRYGKSRHLPVSLGLSVEEN